MKITEFGPIKSSSSVKKRGSTSATSSFADLLDLGGTEDAGAAPALSDVSATTALDNLLSLQEISGEELQRKKLVQQGRNMLDTLDMLRKQLLMGAIPPHTLKDLHRQISIQKQSVADPRLTAIMDEIELRAAVELAKLEMAAKASREPE